MLKVFFFAKAVTGIDAIFEECRWRFQRIFPSERGIERPAFRFDAFAYLNEQQIKYDEWEQIVTNGDPQRLLHLTFLEFFALLEREIKQSEERQRQQKEFEQRIKRK